MEVDSLQKILNSQKIAKAPDEIGRIQDYIRHKYKSSCKVKSQRGALIVYVPNSALAATMHLEQNALIKACELGNFKLVIRTG